MSHAIYPVPGHSSPGRTTVTQIIGGLSDETPLPQRIAIAQAVETSLAAGIGRVKLHVLGQATEADAAQAITLGGGAAVAIVRADEADAAQAIGKSKRKAVVGAIESGTAQQLGEAKRKTIAQATESDEAQAVALAGGNAVAIVGASEADTAGAIAWAPKIRQVQLAAEADTAGVFGELKRKALVGATESGAAQQLGEHKRKAVLAATEAGTAQQLGERKSEAISAASEADTAQAVGKVKRKALAAAAESDQADTIGLVGEASFPITRADEADSAGAVVWAPKVRQVGLASEADVAQLLGRRKSKAVVAAQEADTSQAFNEAKRKAVAGAFEANAAQLLGKVHSRQLVVAAEADSAQTLTVTEARFIAVGLAAELDTAGLVLWSPKVRRVNAAQETAEAQQFGRRHSRTLAAGASTESARPVPHVRGASMVACDEVDQAELLQVLGGGTFQPDPQVHLKVGGEAARLGPPEANIFDTAGGPRLGEPFTGGTTRLGSRSIPTGTGRLGGSL